MDDAEISAIKDCQKGRMESFGLLYDKYIGKIYKFVYYKTNHRETAEDIVSQVFLKAVDKIKDFQINKGTFQAWLYRIARNAVIDHYRSQKYDENVDDWWGLSDSSDIERDADFKIKLEEVDEYLKKLSPEHREIIIMRVWQGLSYAEIAAVTGKTEASCKMMFSRSINKLRSEVPLAVLLLLVFLNRPN
jgi:RNA polymerase sigma-70 factor (ECF subfamily)